MHTAKTVGFLLLGVMLMCAVLTASPKTANWLATGTVTKVDGNTVYFMSRSNAVFRIDISEALRFFAGNSMGSSIRTGDTVRVYGRLIRPGEVKAARIRVWQSAGSRASVGAGPNKEVSIVIEKDADQASSGMEVDIIPPPQPPSEEPPALTWQGKGLVMDIDYVGRQVKIRTSDGQFTVNVNNATIVRGTVRSTFGRLNQGDTIWVAGNEVAPNVVDGRMIRVLRTVSEAQNALPELPVSRVGVIQQIDYPSRTFTMTGQSTVAVISVDDNTEIRFQNIKKCFADLKPGTKINMSGYGNLASGFAAQYIQIIAVSP